MRGIGVLWLVLATMLASPLAAETVRLKATADIWLSDANDQERDSMPASTRG